MMTETEKFVYELTKKTFLSLWSYARPKGKKGKELCDILVYSEPNIVLISVKGMTPTNSGDYNIDWERWKRDAIEKSNRQIYGAERYLNSMDSIIIDDDSIKIDLPPKNDRKYYRIAVLIGGEDKMPLMWGDFGKGFIHVFDNLTTKIILKELDTISDFIKYLECKEIFFKKDNKQILITGGEEDLLAYYLGNHEKLENAGDLLLLGDDLWKGYINSNEYRKWNEDIKDSYLWDNFIELLTKDFKNKKMEIGTDYNEIELVLRTMAKETRYNRILLSREFLDFYKNPKIRSRPVASYSGILYVFLTTDRKEDRDYRRAELIGRCLIVRSYTPEAKIVIGIATEKNDGIGEFSLDVSYLYKPSISKKDKKNVEKMVNEFGWFKNSFKNS